VLVECGEIAERLAAYDVRSEVVDGEAAARHVERMISRIGDVDTPH
jgi:hypothetical protein